MQCFNEIMPVILYLLLSILIIVFIMIGFKLLKTIDKINNTIDDVNFKLTSFDGVTNFIKKTSDYIDLAGTKAVNFLYNKFTNKKGEKNE